MPAVQSNSEYIQSSANGITSSVNSAAVMGGVTKTTFSDSTSSCPTLEPNIVELFLGCCKELFRRVGKDTENIAKVGEGFVTLDNVMAGYATQLNMEVKSGTYAVGDVAFQKKSLGKMGDAANKQNRTVLYVSHNMGTVKRLCSKCAVLDKGHLVYLGDVDTAIGMYAGMKDHKIDTFFELTDARRDVNDIHPLHKSHLSYVRILDKENNNFTRGEIIHLELGIESTERIDNAEIMMIVSYEDDTRVGTSFTKRFVIPDGKRKATVSFDTSTIPEGFYYAELNIKEYKNNGFTIKHDCVEDAFSFVIKGNEDNQWKRNIWGNAHYPDIVVLDIQ